MKMRDWLAMGVIDATTELETDLCAPGYKHDKQDRVLLESKEDMKKRSVASPNHGDALALTFAMPIGAKQKAPPLPARPPQSDGRGWMNV